MNDPNDIWDRAQADNEAIAGERYELQVLKQLGYKDLDSGIAGYNSIGGFMYHLSPIPRRYHVLALIKKPSVFIEMLEDSGDVHNAILVFKSDMSNFTGLTSSIYQPIEDFDWCVTRKYKNKTYYLFDLKPFFKEHN